MQQTKSIMRDALKRALNVNPNQKKSPSVVPALANEKQVKTIRKIQHASDSWREIMKTQTLGTRATVPHQILNYLTGLTTIIFNIKISDQIKFHCRWTPVTMIPNQSISLFRSYALLGERLEENSISAPFPSIEPCPHSFAPSMVERCEVQLINKKWAAIEDRDTIRFLLEEIAGILNHFGGTKNSNTVCEAKQQVFCQLQEGGVTSNTKLQQILNEGVFNHSA